MSPSDVRKAIAAFRLGYLTRILVPVLDGESRAAPPDIIWKLAGKQLQKALATLGDEIAPDVSRQWSRITREMVAYLEKRDFRSRERASQTECPAREYYKGLIEEIEKLSDPASDYPRDWPNPITNIAVSSRYREWHNGGDVLADAARVMHYDDTGIPCMELASEKLIRTLPVALVKRSLLLHDLCQHDLTPMTVEELVERIPQPKQDDFRRAFVVPDERLESVPRDLQEAYKIVLSEQQEVSLRLLFCTVVSMEMKASLEEEATTEEPSDANRLTASAAEQSTVAGDDTDTQPQLSKARTESGFEEDKHIAIRNGYDASPPPIVQASDRPQQAEMKPREYQNLLKTKKNIDPSGDYIGESLPILRVFEKIAALNRLPQKPVLLLGPTGVGKTEIAKLIHDHSKRQGRFCREQAADNKPRDFGVVQGKWAGFGKGHGLSDAPEDQPGLLKECANGTIFVDEVAELDLRVQEYMLQVIDGHPISLVGRGGQQKVHEVRMIFATNQDLDQCVDVGNFKHDFLDRIRRFAVEIPPLSDRIEDVFLFVNKDCGRHKRTSKFLLCLLRYTWPGNVRELREVLELAVKSIGSRKKSELTIDQIEFEKESGKAIIAEIRAKDDEECDREVYAALMAMLQRQGITRRGGLLKRMGTFRGVSYDTVRRDLIRLGIYESS